MAPAARISRHVVRRDAQKICALRNTCGFNAQIFCYSKFFAFNESQIFCVDILKTVFYVFFCPICVCRGEKSYIKLVKTVLKLSKTVGTRLNSTG